MSYCADAYTISNLFGYKIIEILECSVCNSRAVPCVCCGDKQLRNI